jgi:hypothetical protein
MIIGLTLLELAEFVPLIVLIAKALAMYKQDEFGLLA